MTDYYVDTDNGLVGNTGLVGFPCDSLQTIWDSKVPNSGAHTVYCEGDTPDVALISYYEHSAIEEFHIIGNFVGTALRTGGGYTLDGGISQTGVDDTKISSITNVRLIRSNLITTAAYNSNGYQTIRNCMLAYAAGTTTTYQSVIAKTYSLAGTAETNYINCVFSYQGCTAAGAGYNQRLALSTGAGATANFYNCTIDGAPLTDADTSAIIDGFDDGTINIYNCAVRDSFRGIKGATGTVSVTDTYTELATQTTTNLRVVTETYFATMYPNAAAGDYSISMPGAGIDYCPDISGINGGISTDILGNDRDAAASGGPGNWDIGAVEWVGPFALTDPTHTTDTDEADLGCTGNKAAGTVFWALSAIEFADNDTDKARVLNAVVGVAGIIACGNDRAKLTNSAFPTDLDPLGHYVGWVQNDVLYQQEYTADVDGFDFTRSGTPGEQTFQDFEGLIQLVPEDAPAHVGSRTVTNRLDAGVILLGGVATKEEMSSTSMRIGGLAGASDAVVIYPADGYPEPSDLPIDGWTLVSRIAVHGEGVDIGKTVRISISRKQGGSNSEAILDNIELTATPVVYSLSFDAVIDNESFYIRVASGTTNTAASVVISEWQAENAAGQENQNPSEFTEGTKAYPTTNPNRVDANSIVISDVPQVAVPGRLVTNLAPDSPDMSVGWDFQNGTVTRDIADPDGGTNAVRVECTVNTEGARLINQGWSGEYRQSMWLRSPSGITAVRVYVGSTTEVTIIDVGTTWVRVAADVGTPTGTNDRAGFQLSPIGDIIEVYDPQIENVTDQVNQNPGEFVPYHGYFPTDNPNIVDTDGVVWDTGDRAPILSTLKGVLLEDSRTNLFTKSELQDGSSVLSVTGGTLTHGQKDPSGGLNATLLTGDTSDVSHRVSLFNWIGGITQGVENAFQVKVKVAGTTNPAPYIVFQAMTSGNGAWMCVDTATGEITKAESNNTGTYYGSSTEIIGDWILCKIIADIPSAGATLGIVSSTTDQPLVSPTHTTALDLIIAQMMGEGGVSFASSYIPTFGTPVTRPETDMSSTLADIGLPDLTNDFSGMIKFIPAASQANTDNVRFIELSFDNVTTLGFSIYASNKMRMAKRIDGVYAPLIDVPVTLTPGDVFTLKFRASSAGIKMWLNDVPSIEESGGNATDNYTDALTTVTLGATESGGNKNFITVENFHLVAEALTDAEIEAWDTNEFTQDFTSGPGAFDFDRASEATTVDQDGTVVEIPIDFPALPSAEFDGNSYDKTPGRTVTNLVDPDLTTWDQANIGSVVLGGDGYYAVTASGGIGSLSATVAASVDNEYRYQISSKGEVTPAAYLYAFKSTADWDTILAGWVFGKTTDSTTCAAIITNPYAEDMRAQIGGIPNGETVYLKAPQFEDVTGQENQNPSEFVEDTAYFLTENPNIVDTDGVVWDTGTRATMLSTSKGLLLEDERTNIVPTLVSDHSSWSNSVKNGEEWYGDILLERYESDTATEVMRHTTENHTGLAETTYCISAIFKPDEVRQAGIYLHDGVGGVGRVHYNFDTATTAGSTIGTPGIKELSPGYFLIWVVGTSAAAATSHATYIYMEINSNVVLPVGDGLYCGGIQVELGSFPSSRMINGPTGTETRAATNCDKTLAELGLPDLVSPFTVSFEFEVPFSDEMNHGSKYLLSLYTGSWQDSLAAYISVDNRSVRVVTHIDSISQTTSNFCPEILPGERHRVSIRSTVTEGASVALDGDIITNAAVDPFAATPLTTVTLGKNASGTSNCGYPTVRKIHIVDRALTDAEMKGWGAYEFTQDFTSGPGAFDFTRASKATVDGALIPINFPAVPGATLAGNSYTTAGEGLLLEDTRTNTVPTLASDHGVWSRSVKNGEEWYGDILLERYESNDASSGFRRTTRSNTGLAETTYCASAIFKADEVRAGGVFIHDGVGNVARVIYDFDTLVPGYIVGKHGIIELSPGYFLVWASGTTAAGTTDHPVFVYMGPSSSNTVIPVGDGLYCGGVQMEAGSFPSSRMINGPTGTETRAATECTKTLAELGLPDLTNDFSGMIKFKAGHDSEDDKGSSVRLLSLTTGTSTKTGLHIYSYQLIGRYVAAMYDAAGTSLGAINAAPTSYAKGDLITLKFRMTGTALTFWVNNTAITDSGFGTPDAVITTVKLAGWGTTGVVTHPSFMTVEDLHIVDRALSDAEIEAWGISEFTQDFTSGPGAFDFTRASKATVDGALIPINFPAVPGATLAGNSYTAAGEGLLLEDTRTNRFPSSELLSDSTLQNSGVAMTHGQVDPSGGQAATLLVGDTDDGWHNIRTTTGTSTGSVAETENVLSLKVKVAGTVNPSPYIIVCGISSNNGCWICVDTSTLEVTKNSTVGTGTYYGSSVELINDWLHIKLIYETSGTNSYVYVSSAIGSTPGTYTPSHSTALDFIVAQIMIEGGASFASSYIPTFGSTVTRAATNCVKTLAELGLPDLTNDFCGMIKFRPQFNPDDSRSDWLDILSIQAPGNAVFLRYNSVDDVLAIKKAVNWSNSQVETLGDALQYSAGDLITIKFRVSVPGGLWMKVNDLTPVTWATGSSTLPFDVPATEIEIAGANSHSRIAMQSVEFLHIVDRALTVAEIEAWT